MHMHVKPSFPVFTHTSHVDWPNIYLQDSVEIDLADKNGKTPLMLAVGRKHEKVVQYLKKETSVRSKLLPKIDIWWALKLWLHCVQADEKISL